MFFPRFSGVSTRLMPAAPPLAAPPPLAGEFTLTPAPHDTTTLTLTLSLPTAGSGSSVETALQHKVCERMFVNARHSFTRPELTLYSFLGYSQPLPPPVNRRHTDPLRSLCSSQPYLLPPNSCLYLRNPQRFPPHPPRSHPPNPLPNLRRLRPPRRPRSRSQRRRDLHGPHRRQRRPLAAVTDHADQPVQDVAEEKRFW